LNKFRICTKFEFELKIKSEQILKNKLEIWIFFKNVTNFELEQIWKVEQNLKMEQILNWKKLWIGTNFEMEQLSKVEQITNWKEFQIWTISNLNKFQNWTKFETNFIWTNFKIGKKLKPFFFEI
jgi:hypothetical protein